MNVLIIYAHPNPLSFTKAILDSFVKGLREAGHTYEVVDLYKIRFNPVFQDMDSSFFLDEELPPDLLANLNLRENIINACRRAIKKSSGQMVYPEQNG